MKRLAIPLMVLASMALVLAACGERESDVPVVANEPVVSPEAAVTPTGGFPPAVRYMEYPATGEEAPAAVPRSNPLEISDAVVSTGETLFAAMNCDGCHGGGGFGVVGPSLIDGRWRYGGDDSAVFQSIYYGRPRGMPAYGGLLNETVVWQLVSYLRAQPQPEVVPTLAWTE